MLEFRSWVIIQVILLFLSPFNYHHPHSSFSEGTVLRAAWHSWRELAHLPVNPWNNVLREVFKIVSLPSTNLFWVQPCCCSWFFTTIHPWSGLMHSGLQAIVDEAKSGLGPKKSGPKSLLSAK